jgi:hypothetical protein
VTANPETISAVGTTNFYESKLSFDANTIALELGNGVTWGVGSSITAQIGFETSPVPLPAALPLLISVLGLGGLIGWCRRRFAVAG